LLHGVWRLVDAGPIGSSDARHEYGQNHAVDWDVLASAVREFFEE
jgi:hypothetical protein